MSPKSAVPSSTAGQAAPPCLVRSVATALARDPALEAVTVDRQQNTVSVATLGRASDATVVAGLTEALRDLRTGGEACGLLAGTSDCDRCEITDPRLAGQLEIRTDGPRTTISRITCPTAPRFWRWRDLPLPRMVPREVELPEDEAHLNEWKWQLLAAVVCGAAALVAWLLGERPYAIAFHLAAYLAGGWYAAIEVWERLRHRVVDVHFLMLAVAVGSASIGKWEEGATLLFLFALSGALEHYAMGRTQREIRSLFRTAPKVATVLDEAGVERTTAVEQLQPGQRLLIKPGDQFPVDAEVVRGRTAADESNLTGEAVPVEKDVGDTVLAGTLNLHGVVEAVVLRPAAESSLEKIIRLIREAQHLKAPSQRFTDQFGTGYTYGILGLVVAMFFVWWLAFDLPPLRSSETHRSAFYRAMILLVVASPCALVLSIPSAVLAAIAWGARRGVLFRGGAAVENLAQVNVVAMDKTGTLTTGELRVESVESFPPGGEAEVARLAFTLERLSTHPLARAIARHGKQQGLRAGAVTDFESVSGLGLKARVDGQAVWLGRREWVQGERARNGAPVPVPAEVKHTDSSHSEVWVATPALVGRVVLSDALRPESAALVGELQRQGLKLVVLTGDRPEAAAVLQRALGVDDVRAGLKPDDKVAAIRAFTAAGQRVAMVGDGVNDAPSLAAANVGVAMGARGSDAALEQADVVLMHDRLENFLAAFRVSQRARAVIRQNIVISLGTVVVLVGFALAGTIPLTVGVIGHEGSTVVVVMNSLRLLFMKR
ncbi:MAG: heavy metal translocating P-type ATPase [Verrucomicrobia bacterium]|nr:heavy metal translocating P-type ATPase [Verrucomicrobiota bacterium]